MKSRYSGKKSAKKKINTSLSKNNKNTLKVEVLKGSLKIRKLFASLSLHINCNTSLITPGKLPGYLQKQNEN